MIMAVVFAGLLGMNFLQLCIIDYIPLSWENTSADRTWLDII